MKIKSKFGMIAVIVTLSLLIVSTNTPNVVAINPANHIIEAPIRSGEDDGFVTSLLSQGNLVNSDYSTATFSRCKNLGDDKK